MHPFLDAFFCLILLHRLGGVDQGLGKVLTDSHELLRGAVPISAGGNN